MERGRWYLQRVMSGGTRTRCRRVVNRHQLNCNEGGMARNSCSSQFPKSNLGTPDGCFQKICSGCRYRCVLAAGKTFFSIRMGCAVKQAQTMQIHTSIKQKLQARLTDVVGRRHYCSTDALAPLTTKVVTKATDISCTSGSGAGATVERYS